MSRSSKPVLCQFTIAIDTGEQHPFTFCGLYADSRQQYRPLEIRTVQRFLGRHPNSYGDYAIDEMVDGSIDGLRGVPRVAIERKSMDDLHSTLLGFADGHRERFERELQNLAEIESAAVVVECEFCEAIANAPETGRKSRVDNGKIIARSILSLMQRYRGVPWIFAGSRRMAEIATFRWFEKFWIECHKQRKESKSDEYRDDDF